MGCFSRRRNGLDTSVGFNINVCLARRWFHVVTMPLSSAGCYYTPCDQSLCKCVCVSHRDWKVCRDGTAVDYWLVHRPHRCTSFNTETMTGNLRTLNIRLVISPTQNSAKLKENKDKAKIVLQDEHVETRCANCRC